MEGLQEQLGADVAVLHAALKPMAAAGGVRGAGVPRLWPACAPAAAAVLAALPALPSLPRRRPFIAVAAAATVAAPSPLQGSTAPHHHHNQHPSSTATGDSFVRVLLNVAALQNDVAVLLLERLPEFCDAQQQQGQGQGEQQPGGGDDAALPALILGQFRW